MYKLACVFQAQVRHKTGKNQDEKCEEERAVIFSGSGILLLGNLKLVSYRIFKFDSPVGTATVPTSHMNHTFPKHKRCSFPLREAHISGEAL